VDYKISGVYRRWAPLAFAESVISLQLYLISIPHGEITQGQRYSRVAGPPYRFVFYIDDGIDDDGSEESSDQEETEERPPPKRVAVTLPPPVQAHICEWIMRMHNTICFSRY
jgi:hypothetical protein